MLRGRRQGSAIRRRQPARHSWESKLKNTLLHDGLEYWRRETPDKAALVLDGVERLSFSELGLWSDGIAAKLQANGVKPGDNVAVAGANSLEWIATSFGILKAGAVIVPFNERFVAEEFRYLIAHAAPCVIVADAARRDVIKGLGSGVTLLSLEAMSDQKSGAPGFVPVRVSADSLAMIIFTSGTTGKPKGVMKAHGEHLGKYYELRLTDPNCGPNMRLIITFSLHSATPHMFNYSVMNGGTCHFMRSFDPAMALRILSEERITHMTTFPIVLQQIARQPGFATADLSALSTAHTGGTRVPAEVLTTWRDKGVVLRQMYGMTEIGGWAIFGSEEDARAGLQTCGRPMIFTKIRIVRPDGSDCAPEEPGAVLIKGPGMMVGYWRNEEATAQAIIDGWMHSGDIGVFDARGVFRFVDRAKDIIISGGFNVSPSEVEFVISEIHGVKEVAVIGVPDEKYGESTAACIHADQPIDAQAVFAVCARSLAGFKRPRYVFVHDQPLPRLTNGKINKRPLREQYAEAASLHEKLH